MDWKKIFLIVQREYITRVKTRVFILSTLLIPVGFIVYIGVILSFQFLGGAPTQSIGVMDETDTLFERLEERNPERYTELNDQTIDEISTQVLNGSLNGYVILEDAHVTGQMNPEYIYGGNSTVTLQASIRSDLNQVIREERLNRTGVSEEIRTIFESGIVMESRKLTETGDTEDDETLLYTGIGFAMSFMIFFALIMYGTIIMKGVIEEKTSRIVEVIVSSVKPIELLTGKILGISGVAVTQFGLWLILGFLISLAVGPVLMLTGVTPSVDPAMIADMAGASENLSATGFEIPTINPWLIVAFFTYLVLGYFLYSALFAAVGSAADSETDVQQLLMPVMFLMVIAMMINTLVISNPSGTLAVLASLFPFFSPVNMITRLAIGQVPAWQLVLSLLLLLGAIAGTMWVSARIYRAGILQYGKKAGFKDMFKWLRQG